MQNRPLSTLPETKAPAKIAPRNRAERRRAKAVPEAPTPPKPLKRLNAAEWGGLRAAMAARDAAAQQYNEANDAVRLVMAAVKLDPDKLYPLGENGEVYAPK